MSARIRRLRRRFERWRDRCRVCGGSGYTSKPANTDHCCEACGTSGKRSWIGPSPNAWYRDHPPIPVPEEQA